MCSWDPSGPVKYEETDAYKELNRLHRESVAVGGREACYRLLFQYAEGRYRDLRDSLKTLDEKADHLINYAGLFVTAMLTLTTLKKVELNFGLGFGLLLTALAVLAATRVKWVRPLAAPQHPKGFLVELQTPDSPSSEGDMLLTMATDYTRVMEAIRPTADWKAAGVRLAQLFLMVGVVCLVLGFYFGAPSPDS